MAPPYENGLKPNERFARYLGRSTPHFEALKKGLVGDEKPQPSALARLLEGSVQITPAPQSDPTEEMEDVL